MKRTINSIVSIFALSISSAFSATSVQLYIDKLNTSAGIDNPASGSWALIYDQNNDSSLPGNLTDGTSLTIADASSIKAHFASLTIAVGETLANGDKVIATGTIPVGGIIDSEVVTFDVGGADGDLIGGPDVTTGRRFALYWFPELAVGGTLDTSGTFSIGGIFEESANLASFSDYGMTIPANGESGSFLALDSQSGFDQSRLVAVTIPEPASLTLSALGLVALLRRRRK